MRPCFKIMITVLAVVCVAGISGCSSRLSVEKNVLNNDTVANERQPHRRSVLPEYRLGFGDEIEVKFFNNERFNEFVAVRPDGRISLEKIGDVFVLDMTPSQLDSLVTSIYAKFIAHPEVTIFVRKFGGQQVYVLGEVNSPGGYPVQRNTTLLQVLALAGGPKESAKLGSTIILRRDDQGLANALKIDLANPIVKKDNEVVNNDLYVHPLDVVYVPKTFISDVQSFMKNIYDFALPPFDMYLRALWYSQWTNE